MTFYCVRWIRPFYLYKVVPVAPPTAEMYIIIGYRTRGAHFVHIRIGRALLFSMLWTLLFYLVCHVVPNEAQIHSMLWTSVVPIFLCSASQFACCARFGPLAVPADLPALELVGRPNLQCAGQGAIQSTPCLPTCPYLSHPPAGLSFAFAIHHLLSVVRERSSSA